MSFTLYQDQSEFVTNINRSLRDNRRIVACAATGFGKSKVAITICWAALAKGRTVLVVTESTKIYGQLNKEIPGTINIDPDSRLDYLQPGKLYLAMAQTLARRPNLIAQFAGMGDGLLVLNDEAHIGTATKLLLQLPNAYLIGLTATPAMKWAKHLPDLYRSIVVGPQPEWLVANRRLTAYRHAQKLPETGLSTLKVGSTGDYTEESQERIFDTPGAHRFLIEDIHATTYRKCMIFCASIKSAESLSVALTAGGIGHCVQHSRYDIRTEAQQSYSLAQFHDLNQPPGTAGVNICVSVASMNKGYDFPPVDWIILWRATTSLPLYLQMCGRGSRLSPGKLGWLCTDWGANGKQHGRWDAHRDWATMWNTIPKKREGVAPVKICPKCDYMLRPQEMICSNCGHAFKSREKEQLESVKTVMLERPKYGKKLSQLTAIELANWSTENKQLNYAIRVAKANEQKEEGFLRTFGMAKGYKENWHMHHMPSGKERIFFHDKMV